MDWRRGFVDPAPEESDLLEGICELAEIDGFDHVGVDAELVTADDVLFLAGGREHDDRDAAQLGIAFEASQDVDAVYFGHFEIQYDGGGHFIEAIRVLAAAEKVIEGLSAITDHYDIIGETVFLQRGERQLDVVDAVIHQQDVPKQLQLGGTLVMSC